MKDTELKRYDAYKASGVEWLGEIPAHWEVISLKFLSIIYNGDSLNDKQKDFFEQNPSGIPYLSTKDIISDVHAINYDTGLLIPINNNSFKKAFASSILLCIEGGSAGKKLGFLDREVHFVNKLACFRFKEGIKSRFYFFYLQSADFQNQFNLALSGLIGGVGISLLRNFKTPWPTISEQTAITQFLNSKTALIDKAIVLKEQQIALLKERSQAFIQQAVTKGLNPDVPMKDSGIDWMGKIPVHWKIVKNKILFQERKEPGNDSLPLLSVSIHNAVSDEELNEDENIRGKIRIKDKSQYKLVKPGDITFNMMRAWQGGIGAVKRIGMVSPAYIVAQPQKILNSIFWEYQYRTDKFIQQMDCSSKGITDFRKRLYWDEFKQLYTVLPPESEQNEIAQRISLLNEKVNALIEKKINEIEKLKEYKASLINSAVTGKIKVS